VPDNLNTAEPARVHNFKGAMPMLRNTPYAEELHEPAVYPFSDGSEGRIEHLRFKKGEAADKDGYRLSWWKLHKKTGRTKMAPRPLDVTEDELLKLMGSAIKEGVFTERFVDRLRKALA
jgi:hypothetical protein